jgi:hypothetical protein
MKNNSQKSGTLEEMDEFLESCNLLRLIMPISNKEIKWVIKRQVKSLGPDDLSVLNSTKH